MTLLEKAIAAIDLYNQNDPNSETWQGKVYPKEYLESIKRTEWLEKLVPEAREALKIATRSQHIGRWEIPRNSYDSTRTGYLAWRSDLAKHHAEKAGLILKDLGFAPSMIERVQQLNLKKNIKLDPEAQTIEDILCLVFLENHIDSFAPSQDEEVMVNIIQKTWKKMGEKGREEALKINYQPEILNILKKALSI